MTEEERPVPAHLADRSDAELETLLRGSLAARSQQIDHADLRPARPVTARPAQPLAGGPGHPVTGGSGHPVTGGSGHPVTGRPARAGWIPDPRRAVRHWPRTLAVAATAAGLLAVASVAVLARPATPPLADGRRPSPSIDTLRVSPPVDGGHPSPPFDGQRPSPSARSAPSASAPAPTMGTVHSPTPGRSGPVMAFPPDQQPVSITVNAGATGGQRLTIVLTPHTSAVPGVDVTVTYPVATVSGGDAGIRRRVALAVNSRITALRSAYHARAARLPQSGPLTQTIRFRTQAQWGHTLSIVLDDIEDNGTAIADSISVALVLDTRTGRALTAADLFTDLPAVDALMRAAVLRSVPPGTVRAPDLARLSMHPDGQGFTRPLAWYPTTRGLHWQIGAGAIADETAGDLEVTVGWDRLTAFLTGTARG